MIQKVNRPTFLKMGSGSHQGSGMAYDGPPQDEPREPKKEPISETEDFDSTVKKPHLSLVVAVEQAGMTEVVKDLMESLRNEPQPAQPGLSIRYSNDASPVKGLLLNRKAE